MKTAQNPCEKQRLGSQKASRTFVIALTGPMAAGKNYVCSLLEKMGCVCTDADALTHIAIENAKEKILEAFSSQAEKLGIKILNGDGSINRRELAKIVFSSPQNIALQESLVHPEVEKLMEKFIEENQDRTVILNATVLYKTQIIQRCDAVIFVTAPMIVRFFRAKKRDKMKTTQIFQRFYAQKALFAKYKFLRADIYKVRNFSSKKVLEQKLNKILTDIGYEGI